MKPTRINILATSLSVFSMTQAANAGSGTWKTVATDGLWHNTANWSAGAIPNAVADIATFNSGSNFTTVSIGSTNVTVDRINFSGASTAAYTLTGTGFTNMIMSTDGGGVFIDSGVMTNQDLSGIPIIRPGMSDTINFSNQGSGSLKLGTFQAANETGSLSTLVFKPGANGNIEIVSGKTIANAGTGGVKKIAVVLDDVGTLNMALTTGGSWDGTDADGNSVTIRQGTYQAASIKNSGTASSLGAGGRIQFGKASTTNTATLDYYGASDTTNRAFYIIDNNTAVFKVSGGASTNLSITSAITQSASTNGGGKLTKDGVGILTLSNSNSYSNQTTITAGTLKVGHVNALGTAGTFASRTTINTGGTLELATNSSVAAEWLDVLSNQTGAVVVNRATEGAGITHSTGPTYLGSTSTLNVTKGANVTSGTATLGIASVILASGSVGTGTLNSDTAAISVTGSVSSGVAFAKTLALTGSHAESEISGVISDGSGTVSLTKSGSGTWTLSNASNTYTGATQVNGGVLNVTGSTAADSAVSVGGASATGTPRLAGSGTINGAVTVKSASGGVVGGLDAGDAGSSNPAGKLTVNNNLTFETGSIFEWDIKDGSTMTEGAGDRGVQYDAVDITGGGALSVTDSVFRVVMNTGEFDTGTFWDTDRTWASSSIFNVGGSLSGFTSLEWYEGSTLKGQSSDLSGRLTDGYFAISGTSLTWTAVPEPTSALVGLLIGAGLLRRRRGC